MPSLSGKAKKQESLIKDLSNVFRSVMKKYNLAAGDFPEMEGFRRKLTEMNFSKFPKLNTKMMDKLDAMLSKEIPYLMDSLPAELRQGFEGMGQLSTKMNAMSTNMPSVPTPKTHTVSDVESRQKERDAAVALANAAKTPPKPPTVEEEEETNPFADEEEEDSNPFGKDTEDVVPWLLQDEKDLRWDSEFETWGPKDGKLGAKDARQALMKTEVPTKSLRVIWDLSDIDKDGKLDSEEVREASEERRKGGATRRS